MPELVSLVQPTVPCPCAQVPGRGGDHPQAAGVWNQGHSMRQASDRMTGSQPTSFLRRFQVEEVIIRGQRCKRVDLGHSMRLAAVDISAVPTAQAR